LLPKTPKPQTAKVVINFENKYFFTITPSNLGLTMLA